MPLNPNNHSSHRYLWTIVSAIHSSHSCERSIFMFFICFDLLHHKQLTWLHTVYTHSFICSIVLIPDYDCWLPTFIDLSIGISVIFTYKRITFHIYTITIDDYLQSILKSHDNDSNQSQSIWYNVVPPVLCTLSVSHLSPSGINWPDAITHQLK